MQEMLQQESKACTENLNSRIRELNSELQAKDSMLEAIKCQMDDSKKKCEELLQQLDVQQEQNAQTTEKTSKLEQECHALKEERQKVVLNLK